MTDGRNIPFAVPEKVTFTSDGAYVCLTVLIKDGSRESFKLTYDAYAESVKGKAELSPDDMERLSSENAYCEALISALRSLSYGSNTSAELYRKLIAKRFPKDEAMRAVKHLKRSGFIDEEEIAREEVSACVAKLKGPSYVRSRILARGFGSKGRAEAERQMLNVDFDEVCLECAKMKLRQSKKRFSSEDPLPYEEKQRLISQLVRSGHTYDSSRSAIERLTSDEDFF